VAAGSTARRIPDPRISIAFPTGESNGAEMRNPLLASSVFGLTGVALGAFGAHALHDTLVARGSAASWETAVHYHLFHALALLAVGLARPAVTGPWLRRATLAWSAGIILFSGSIYLFALGGPKVVGIVFPPLGGLGFMTGWVCIFMQSRTSGPSAPDAA
jgi:uncharacterized membrane protein YgdD (TMEM256/DUF423 family)